MGLTEFQPIYVCPEKKVTRRKFFLEFPKIVEHDLSSLLSRQIKLNQESIESDINGSEGKNI